MRSLKIIQRQIEEVIESSQEYPFQVFAGDIVKDWYEAKKVYIDFFGGETSFLIEENITIELDEEQKSRRFKSFMADIYDNEAFESGEAEDGTWFTSFLTENEKGFFNNTVVKDYPALKIKKGMKLLKAFKFFISDFDNCRKAQDLASRYIQVTKVSGDLYLSVDPLDFLALSENNNNWHSCHALDGDYRAGNINYMLDNTTLIAFLAPKELIQLKSFPEGLLWNNKKWRMLIHTKGFKDICYFNRQYPFDDWSLLTKVYYGINKIIPTGYFYFPETIGFRQIKLGTDNINLDYNYILGDGYRLYDSREVIDDSESLGYNDLKYSPYYSPIASLADEGKYRSIVRNTDDIEEWDEAFHDTFDITIGKKFKCLKCGEGEIERGDSFLCELCIAEEDWDEDRFWRCTRCGRRLYSSGESWMDSDGDIVCKACHMAITYPVGVRRNIMEVDVNGR